MVKYLDKKEANQDNAPEINSIKQVNLNLNKKRQEEDEKGIKANLNHK